jgi:hypothetical protein
LSLDPQPLIGGRAGERSSCRVEFQRSVRVWMVIALEHVIDADEVAGILGDGESDGVRPLGSGEAGTGAAGVPEVAERQQGSLVGLTGAVGGRVAKAGPEGAQGEHRMLRIGVAAARCRGAKMGAGHFGGIVTQA